MLRRQLLLTRLFRWKQRAPPLRKRHPRAMRQRMRQRMRQTRSSSPRQMRLRRWKRMAPLMVPLRLTALQQQRKRRQCRPLLHSTLLLPQPQRVAPKRALRA